jgi:hypothetical protein
MPSGTTPYLGLTLPTVGGDNGIWGNETNTNWSTVDTNASTVGGQINTINVNLSNIGNTANSALQLAGGTMTGNLNINNNVLFLDPNFWLFIGENQPTINFDTNSYMYYDRSSPLISFVISGGSPMFITSTSVSVSGELFCQSPTIGDEAATKQYVDTAVSDIRLKDNVKPIENALELVNKLNPISFTWNEKAKQLGEHGNSYGFIAQEIETVLPHSTMQSAHEGYLGIKREILLAYVVKSIQELSAKIG